MTEIERYTRAVCDTIKANYDDVVSGGHPREGARITHKCFWVRYVVVRKFCGGMLQKDVAKFLNITPHSVSHIRRRWEDMYRKNHNFKQTILYLQQKGFEGLTEEAVPPHELTKSIDRHIDTYKQLQKQIDSNIDDLYRIKVEMNKYIKR